MAFGGFDNNQEQPIAEMNVIPLVDIMLVLLVIFIITAPVLIQAVKVELPEARSQMIDNRERAKVITITAEEIIRVDEQAVNIQELPSYFENLYGNNPEVELHFHADHAASYGVVARVMAAAQSAGILKIGFITDASAGAGQ